METKTFVAAIADQISFPLPVITFLCRGLGAAKLDHGNSDRMTGTSRSCNPHLIFS